MSVLMKADGTQTTLKNVSIELEVTSDTFVENLDAVGIYNKHGTLTFEGNETNVVVIQNGTQKNSSNPESDDVLDAIGYIAMDPTPDAKVGTVVTNFNADKTTFNVLTEPVRRKPLILMGGKAHKVFGRAVTLPYAHLHLFLHRRTSASCERSAESFSRKGV